MTHHNLFKVYSRSTHEHSIVNSLNSPQSPQSPHLTVLISSQSPQPSYLPALTVLNHLISSQSSRSPRLLALTVLHALVSSPRHLSSAPSLSYSSGLNLRSVSADSLSSTRNFNHGCLTRDGTNRFDGRLSESSTELRPRKSSLPLLERTNNCIFNCPLMLINYLPREDTFGKQAKVKAKCPNVSLDQSPSDKKRAGEKAKLSQKAQGACNPCCRHG
jgi:hypothetical protein